MWPDANRTKYNRDHLRYPGDLTDAEWVEIEPLIPPAKKGGDKRRAGLRAIVSGIMYILSTGCQWRYLPEDLPPRSTVHDYFTLRAWDGTLDRIHHALYVRCREKVGREASPTACIIDRKTREKRRTLRQAQEGARIDPHGFDAGNPSMNSGDQGQEATHSRRHAGVTSE